MEGKIKLVFSGQRRI